jgi:hypothetical protein
VKESKTLLLWLFFLLLPLKVFSFDNIPIANYRFDECYWDKTPNEVTDSNGFNNNGSLTPGGTANTTPHGKLCYGAKLEGSAIDINSLDLITANGAKTTVMFWIYWDGQDKVIPFGFNRYSLWFYDGRFGFSTSKSLIDKDIYGIDSSLLKYGWHI